MNWSILVGTWESGGVGVGRGVGSGQGAWLTFSAGVSYLLRCTG